jgi:cellulose synthase/poly-beta-1,6-N-acetylglucosamine synthase-like glycosyltransferase
MILPIIYLLKNAVHRFLDFFRHWYIDTPQRWHNFFILVIRRFDRVLVLKPAFVHLSYFIRGGPATISSAQGVFLVVGRVIFAAVLYLLVAIIFLLVFIAWISTPIFVVVMTYLEF